MGVSNALPFSNTILKNSKYILCSASRTVSLQHMSLFTLSEHAHDIRRAAKLTESPSTEYSLLDPLVPTTPANTLPVATPTAHEH